MMWHHFHTLIVNIILSLKENIAKLLQNNKTLIQVNLSTGNEAFAINRVWKMLIIHDGYGNPWNSRFPLEYLAAVCSIGIESCLTPIHISRYIRTHISTLNGTLLQLRAWIQFNNGHSNVQFHWNTFQRVFVYLQMKGFPISSYGRDCVLSSIGRIVQA